MEEKLIAVARRGSSLAGGIAESDIEDQRKKKKKREERPINFRRDP